METVDESTIRQDYRSFLNTQAGKFRTESSQRRKERNLAKEQRKRLRKQALLGSPTDLCVNDCAIYENENDPAFERFRGRKWRLLQFAEDFRPPYFGTWTKHSERVGPRRPWAMDSSLVDYSCDSEAEWEEDEIGEELGSEVGDDEDLLVSGVANGDADDDMNDWLVPDGYLSEDEVNDDEEGKTASTNDKPLRDMAKKKIAPLVPIVVSAFESDLTEDVYLDTFKIHWMTEGVFLFCFHARNDFHAANTIDPFNYKSQRQNIDELVNHLKPVAIVGSLMKDLKTNSEKHSFEDKNVEPLIQYQKAQWVIKEEFAQIRGGLDLTDKENETYAAVASCVSDCPCLQSIMDDLVAAETVCQPSTVNTNSTTFTDPESLASYCLSEYNVALVYTTASSSTTSASTITTLASSSTADPTSAVQTGFLSDAAESTGVVSSSTIASSSALITVVSNSSNTTGTVSSATSSDSPSMQPGAEVGLGLAVAAFLALIAAGVNRCRSTSRAKKNAHEVEADLQSPAPTPHDMTDTVKLSTIPRSMQRSESRKQSPQSARSPNTTAISTKLSFDSVYADIKQPETVHQFYEVPAPAVTSFEQAYNGESGVGLHTNAFELAYRRQQSIRSSFVPANEAKILPSPDKRLSLQVPTHSGRLMQESMMDAHQPKVSVPFNSGEYTFPSFEAKGNPFLGGESLSRPTSFLDSNLAMANRESFNARRTSVNPFLEPTTSNVAGRNVTMDPQRRPSFVEVYSGANPESSAASGPEFKRLSTFMDVYGGRPAGSS
ncbi:hypothetical protein HDU82_002958 [Entophlyctis luteolus]|nr:hypothetical protein HDU82_002958 [Entophlyctis luteolus]